MKAGIYGMLAAVCLILGGCGAQGNIHGQHTEQSTAVEGLGSVMPVDSWEPDNNRIYDVGIIDVELLRSFDYSLRNPELGLTILMCPYDEVHLLSEGYGELEQAIDVLNAENNSHMGVLYEELRERMEERIVTGDGFSDYGLLPFGFYRKICVLRSDEALLSLRIEDTEWLGGFHPNYYFYGVNFEPLTGQRLQLADVVTDYGRTYELVLEQLASEEYIDEDGRCVLAEGYEKIVKQAFYPQEPGGEQVKWWLDTEGLTVSFDTYELASYAEGNQALKFSFEEFGDLVKPEYICHRKDGSR